MIIEEALQYAEVHKLNQLGNAFVFMVRYALPRKTSADMATVTALKSWWKEIPATHKKMILQEMESEKGLWGNDSWLWDEFLEWERKNRLEKTTDDDTNTEKDNA